MTMLIDTPDGLMPLYKAKRACAYCGEWYVSSNKNVKTCSPSCGQKLAKPLMSHTCHGCGVRFRRKGKRNRHKYCTRACAFKHTEDRLGKHRGVADGAMEWMQSWSMCKVCGNEHTKMGQHCSVACSRVTAYTQQKGTLACGSCGIEMQRVSGGHTGPRMWCDACAMPMRAELKRKQRRASQSVRRARLRQLPTERIDPYDIFARDGWRCQMCLRQVDVSLPVNHDLRPNLDHIIPVSKGGSHTRNNLQCLCRRCNSDKRDKVLQTKGIWVSNLQRETD